MSAASRRLGSGASAASGLSCVGLRNPERGARREVRGRHPRLAIAGFARQQPVFGARSLSRRRARPTAASARPRARGIGAKESPVPRAGREGRAGAGRAARTSAATAGAPSRRVASPRALVNLPCSRRVKPSRRARAGPGTSMITPKPRRQKDYSRRSTALASWPAFARPWREPPRERRKASTSARTGSESCAPRFVHASAAAAFASGVARSSVPPGV